jgi:ABC-type transport system substrate-binding protein
MERNYEAMESDQPKGESGISRRMVLRMLAASAAAGSALPLLPATGAAPALPKKGGIVRYGLSTDPPHLDPHVDSGGASSLVKGTIYSLLVRLNEKMEIVPDLAESWEWPDSLTGVFRLRKNVKWHDGSDFTSADVKASMERILDPKTGAWARGDLRHVQRVETPDPLTVRFVLSRPDAALLATLAFANSLIAQKALIERGADLRNQIIGTGPFKLAARQPGVQTRLVRNEQYYLPERIHLDGITFIPYPDDTSRTSALRTGAVDIIDYVPWKDMSIIEADRKLVLYSDREGAHMYLLMGVDKPPLDNPKVRQAINYAIDRQAVLDTIFFGRGRVLGGLPIPEWMFIYSPDRQKVYAQDLNRAKQLLAEAGYPNGFKISLLSTTTYAMHRSTAEVVHASLRKIGIDVQLDMPEWATTIARRNKGDFEMCVNGTGVDTADPSYFLDQYFHSAGPYTRSCRFADKQVDEALERGRATYEAEARKLIYRGIEPRLLELCPYAWICTREQAEAAQAYVKNYAKVPGARSTQHKVVEVWLDK